MNLLIMLRKFFHNRHLPLWITMISLVLLQASSFGGDPTDEELERLGREFIRDFARQQGYEGEYGSSSVDSELEYIGRKTISNQFGKSAVDKGYGSKSTYDTPSYTGKNSSQALSDQEVYKCKAVDNMGKEYVSFQQTPCPNPKVAEIPERNATIDKFEDQDNSSNNVVQWID